MLIYLSMIETEEDKSRFEIVYHEYKSLMFYVANQILQNEHDAEDAVHQAFVKIAEHMEKISQPKCPQTRGFVVTIVERKAIDQYRARKKQRTLLPDEEYINTPGVDELEHLPERLVFAKAMAMLPTKYRELLLLKYDCGYTALKEGDTDCLIWFDEFKGIAFQVDGFLDRETLFRVAESITMK